MEDALFGRRPRASAVDLRIAPGAIFAKNIDHSRPENCARSARNCPGACPASD
jgi:hypothetical protein